MVESAGTKGSANPTHHLYKGTTGGLLYTPSYSGNNLCRLEQAPSCIIADQRYGF